MLGRMLADRYKILRILGGGGFGQTYVATDTWAASPTECVVKHLRPANQASDFLDIARRLFQAEVESLRRLGEHDQIPALIDSFEDDGEFYLVQQYVHGFPFSEELTGGFRLDEDQVIQILTDVLHILEFVHNHRVIHRDVKPGNLIRRPDGKLVLIDFGAVKEIHTQLATKLEGQTALTVGIGTQGYTPGEQLAGKPRYSSDLYALGMVAIQALTGLQPSQVPENPQTGELEWTQLVNIHPGLKLLVQKLTRQHVVQRYQSAQEALRDLQRLDDLPQAITFVEAIAPTQLPELTQGQLGWKHGVRAIAIATVAAAGLCLGLRQIGGLESLDLAIYDRLWQLQPDPGVDDRLLIVEINDADLQALQRVTPTDATIATVIDQLQQHTPRVIGLDLYRELPQGEGHDDLMRAIQADNVVVIAEIGDAGEQFQVPPPAAASPNQVGFNDIVLDDDNVVRRNLLFARFGGQTYYSFSLRAALQYLAADGILPQGAPENPEALTLNNQTLPPLVHTVGGYHPVDTRGYQILLDYGSPSQVARTVSISDVLAGTVNPDWVRDRLVLIGTTAESGKDMFQTPFSAVGDQAFMPGVVVHAHMVRQILTHALDDRRVFWFWPNWAEVSWIVGAAIAGGTLAWIIRRPLLLAGGGLVLIAVIGGTTVLCFVIQGWVPATGAIAACILSGLIVISFRLYWAQQDSDRLAAALAPWQSAQSVVSAQPSEDSMRVR